MKAPFRNNVLAYVALWGLFIFNAQTEYTNSLIVQIPQRGKPRYVADMGGYEVKV
jgi:hypothetical protein